MSVSHYLDSYMFRHFDRVDLERGPMPEMDEAADLAFWAAAAANYLRPLFAAAMLTGHGGQEVARWLGGENFSDAEEVLRTHGLGAYATELAAFRAEPPRAAAAISAAMLSAVSR
jgi:hypothetical protein